MQVNRPPVPMPHQAQLDASHNAKASNTTAASEASKAGPKHRITSRTEDYLLRLRSHGTLLQKNMANAAYAALRNDTFISNPAREIPVSQFGIGTTLNERKGILLANFMPHNDKLELVALGFRAQRYFDSDAGGMDSVVLEDARDLPAVKIAQFLADLPSTRDRLELQRPHAEPEVQPQRTNTDESAHNARSSEADVAASRKALEKAINRYESQSMYRKMTDKLADQRIKDGRSSSRWTGLPTAHAAVVSGLVRTQAIALGGKVRSQASTVDEMMRTLAPERIKRMITKRDASLPLQPKAPAESAVTKPLPAKPIGQQYQFGKNEFSNFYEDHWLLDPANAPMGKKGVIPTDSDEEEANTGQAVGNPPVTPGSTFPERRPARLTSSSVPLGWRHARLISDDLARQLNEQVEGAYALRNRQGAEELEGNRQLLQSNNEEFRTGSASRAGSDGSSISSSQLDTMRQALPQQLIDELDASDDSDSPSDTQSQLSQNV